MRVRDGRIFDVAASETPVVPETTPVVPPPPAVEPEPAPPEPEPEPVRAESPPPAKAATTDRVLRSAAVLSIVGAVLLAIGVRVPWDFRGRSWLDLKFGANGIEDSGIFTGFAPVTPRRRDTWQRSRSRSVPGRASWAQGS